MLQQHTGLYTDQYELTMAQGYFLEGKHQTQANFDYFFRKLPFKGGYVVFAGLADLLQSIEAFKYEKEDLEYLGSIGFQKDFLQYLSRFRFQGSIYSVAEGEVVFANEPILRVEGNLLETQIIETLVLNLLNFQSLIATKAARMKQVAGDRAIVDFGLRRAQGLGGIHASRAAIIGGAKSTSNVYSARLYGLTPTGTMAHSWIQSFEDELKAFRSFASAFPERCILLVDTYDTLKSGIPNAIKVAQEMKQTGHQLFGVRLDSGDLSFLAKKSRKMLDDAGLQDVKIVASNQLDEYVIKSLIDQRAPIDSFGVGTNLITGKDDAALDGVYKLSQSDGKPRLKISENIEKIILPGLKKLYRVYRKDHQFYGDAVTLNDEERIDKFIHPHQPDKVTHCDHCELELIHQKVMNNGKIERDQPTVDQPTVDQIAAYASQRLSLLPDEHRRFENPHIYKVGVSEKLLGLRNQMIDEMKNYTQ